MTAPIVFYYEFSSPFGYLASEMIGDLAQRHGRAIDWKPFLLGPVFKAEGTQSLMSYPMKGAYSARDLERTARLHGIPFKWPSSFPFLSVAAARAAYWAGQRDQAAMARVTQALYRACFGEGRDISHSSQVADVLSGEGYEVDVVEAALKDPGVKQMLKDENDDALSKGVFGSPMFLVEGEPFWGVDKLPMLDRWLETGGW